ncbi:hypothetical protein BKA83DRAFT_2393176 [Pisolithus microcarpus]|nr:hypothetical protein BKA83DRAFT_2393176 [Pisolithus microcarpus]
MLGCCPFFTRYPKTGTVESVLNLVRVCCDIRSSLPPADAPASLRISSSVAAVKQCLYQGTRLPTVSVLPQPANTTFRFAFAAIIITIRALVIKVGSPSPAACPIIPSLSSSSTGCSVLSLHLDCPTSFPSQNQSDHMCHHYLQMLPLVSTANPSLHSLSQSDVRGLAKWCLWLRGNFKNWCYLGATCWHL